MGTISRQCVVVNQYSSVGIFLNKSENTRSKHGE